MPPFLLYAIYVDSRLGAVGRMEKHREKRDWFIKYLCNKLRHKYRVININCHGIYVANRKIGRSGRFGWPKGRLSNSPRQLCTRQSWFDSDLKLSRDNSPAHSSQGSDWQRRHHVRDLPVPSTTAGTLGNVKSPGVEKGRECGNFHLCGFR